jgi:hypothetical protein
MHASTHQFRVSDKAKKQTLRSEPSRL